MKLNRNDECRACREGRLLPYRNSKKLTAARKGGRVIIGVSVLVLLVVAKVLIGDYLGNGGWTYTSHEIMFGLAFLALGGLWGGSRLMQPKLCYRCSLCGEEITKQEYLARSRT